MPYKNKDPGAEKDGMQIANQTAEYFEHEIDRVIKGTYANRDWSPLSMELRAAAIDEIRRIFSDKLLESKKMRRENDWRYKAQDELYPNLREEYEREHGDL